MGVTVAGSAPGDTPVRLGAQPRRLPTADARGDAQCRVNRLHLHAAEAPIATAQKPATTLPEVCRAVGDTLHAPLLCGDGKADAKTELPRFTLTAATCE